MIGTDTAAERIWNTSAGQPGSHGMLQAYLLGDAATALQAVPATDRAAHIRKEVQRFLPALDQEIIASHVTLWQEDPYAGGAFALAQKGQLSWILPAARTPDGRLHFAGEHTSASIGWMDGALESGERAAAEIIARHDEA